MRRLTHILSILIFTINTIQAQTSQTSLTDTVLPGLIFQGTIPVLDDIVPSDTGTVPSTDDVFAKSPDLTFISSDLQALNVNARIIDGVAEVTMTQHFQTPVFFPDRFILQEAAYQIPLDELAAITEFRAEVDDRIIEAIVKEKGEARQEFDEAVASGKQAFLAEQTRADIFRISVGNIPKGKLVKVTLVYITSLDTIGEDTVRFVFPTGVTPRYRPLNTTEEAIAGDMSLMDQGVNIEVDISMASSISNITSNTHTVEVQSDEDQLDHAVVKVTDEDPQERDLVILITTMANYEPQIYFESSSEYNTTAIMLSIVPDMSLDLANSDFRSEFVFIIDRSGSMSGENIQQTRQAMSHIIEQIPDGSLFNIIGFGSEFDVLFDEGSRPIASQDAKASALTYIQMMDADFGGTEILSPLKYALGGVDMPLLSTYDRVVLVLTDGAVENTDDVIEYVHKHQSNGRVFALGIGNHVSALLVRGIARSGKGTAEFVDGDSLDAIEDAVERQIEAASQPALSDVEIQWGTLEKSSWSQSPFVAPNLLLGKRFLVFLIVDGMGNVPETVKISSTVMNTDSSIEYEVNAESFLEMSTNSNGLDSDLIHKMACRSLIRELEEGGSELHSVKGVTEEDINKEIVRLGLKYQIASSQTSFVAVDNEGWTEREGVMMDEVEADSGMVVASSLGSTFAGKGPIHQASPAVVAHQSNVQIQSSFLPVALESPSSSPSASLSNFPSLSPSRESVKRRMISSSENNEALTSSSVFSLRNVVVYFHLLCVGFFAFVLLLI